MQMKPFGNKQTCVEASWELCPNMSKWASQVLESMDDTIVLPNPQQYNMLYLSLQGLYLEV